MKDRRGNQSSDFEDIYSNSGENTPGYSRSYDYDDDDEVDCYNSVGRDIYSISGKERGFSKKRKRKSGCAGKFFTVLLSALILAAIFAAADLAVLYTRLDRSGSAGSSQMAHYAQQPPEAPAWDIQSAPNVTNVLLIGVDKNENGSDGRSDSSMLLSVNSSTKQLHLVSFLRDTYLQIPTMGKNKLNAAFAAGGPALTMQTLENNYRIGIDEYISVDFSSFSKIIDQMGGLDVPMSQAACTAENENMGSHLKPGVNHLNGKLCLYYARIREAADEHGHDDYGRTGRQRQVIELIIQKMKRMNPLEVSKILYDYFPYVKTNLSYPDFMRLGLTGLTISGYKTETLQIPAANTFTEADVKEIGDVLKPDLKKNCTILRSALYGSKG